MDKGKIHEVKMRFGIVGNAEALNRAIDIAMQVASTDLSVLIVGENGVGKESFPKIIHQFSARKHGRYIAVNCGAIPPGTINSELFGHEKGAFTGADRDRKGYFAEADGGTIFLDEVAELPKETQSLLLRILENHEYMRVGSSVVQKADVRVIAATNVNLQEAVAQGRFREDLYYRLNTIPIQIIPLRERGSDIVLLFRKFAADIAETYKMPVVQLTDDAKQLLQQYRWPGNVRQLKNVTEQISIIETNRVIDAVTLQRYLPDVLNISNLPMLASGGEAKGMGFENEREILYKILFDLRRDVTEMKKVIHDLMNGQAKDMTQMAPTENSVSYVVNNTPMPSSNPPMVHASVVEASNPTTDESYIQDMEVLDEPLLTFNDVQREMMRKTLEKYGGNRKKAAAELDISERTFYRKLKKYGLE